MTDTRTQGHSVLNTSEELWMDDDAVILLESTATAGVAK